MAQCSGGVDDADRLGIRELRFKCITLPARMASSGVVGQPEVGNGKVQRQLAGLAGFKHKVGRGAFDLIHCQRRSEAFGAQAAGTAGSFRGENAIWGQMNVQPLQFDCGDVDGLARL
jgi:hypothetical protein